MKLHHEENNNDGKINQEDPMKRGKLKPGENIINWDCLKCLNQDPTTLMTVMHAEIKKNENRFYFTKKGS